MGKKASVAWSQWGGQSGEGRKGKVREKQCWAFWDILKILYFISSTIGSCWKVFGNTRSFCVFPKIPFFQHFRIKNFQTTENFKAFYSERMHPNTKSLWLALAPWYMYPPRPPVHLASLLFICISEEVTVITTLPAKYFNMAIINLS